MRDHKQRVEKPQTCIRGWRGLSSGCLHSAKLRVYSKTSVAGPMLLVSSQAFIALPLLCDASSEVEGCFCSLFYLSNVAALGEEQHKGGKFFPWLLIFSA